MVILHVAYRFPSEKIYNVVCRIVCYRVVNVIIHGCYGVNIYYYIRYILNVLLTVTIEFFQTALC